jgi:signal peptidase II
VFAKKNWPVWGALAAAAALFVDRLSKYIVVEKIMRPPGLAQTPFYTAHTIQILPILDIRLSWNPGISFSLFNSGEATTVTILLIVKALITAGLIWFLWRLQRPWLQVACGFVIGGALGNIVDNLTVGAVADFLYFHWGAWDFPVFNLADTAITVGAIMWLLDAFFGRHHPAAQTGDTA